MMCGCLRLYHGEEAQGLVRLFFVLRKSTLRVGIWGALVGSRSPYIRCQGLCCRPLGPSMRLDLFIGVT